MNHLADEIEQRAAHLNDSYEKMLAALDKLRQIDGRGRQQMVEDILGNGRPAYRNMATGKLSFPVKSEKELRDE